MEFTLKLAKTLAKMDESHKWKIFLENKNIINFLENLLHSKQIILSLTLIVPCYRQNICEMPDSLIKIPKHPVHTMNHLGNKTDDENSFVVSTSCRESGKQEWTGRV